MGVGRILTYIFSIPRVDHSQAFQVSVLIIVFSFERNAAPDSFFYFLSFDCWKKELWGLTKHKMSKYQPAILWSLPIGLSITLHIDTFICSKLATLLLIPSTGKYMLYTSIFIFIYILHIMLNIYKCKYKYNNKKPPDLWSCICQYKLRYISPFQKNNALYIIYMMCELYGGWKII